VALSGKQVLLVCALAGALMDTMMTRTAHRNFRMRLDVVVMMMVMMKLDCTVIFEGGGVWRVQ
jgi:hypothetical protein